MSDFPISPETQDFLESAAILAEPYNEQIAELQAKIEQLQLGHGLFYMSRDRTMYRLDVLPIPLPDQPELSILVALLRYALIELGFTVEDAP